MLDRLFEFLTLVWKLIMPWRVVMQYQSGIILRLGKYNRTIGPGLKFMFPIIEVDFVVDVVPTTITLPFQTIQTNNGKQATVRFILKYCVDDCKTFLLEVSDAKDVLIDETQAAIYAVVHENEEKKLFNTTWMENEIGKLARRRIKGWGVNVISVKCTDFAYIRSIRILLDRPQAPDEVDYNPFG